MIATHRFLTGPQSALYSLKPPWYKDLLLPTPWQPCAMWNQTYRQTKAFLLSVQHALRVFLELRIGVDLVFPLQDFPVLSNGLPVVCLFGGSAQRTFVCSCKHDTFYSHLKLAERDSGAVLVATMMATLSQHRTAFHGNGQLKPCAAPLADVQNFNRFLYASTQHFNMHHFDLEHVGHLPFGLQLERQKLNVHTRVNKFCNHSRSENPNTQMHPRHGC